MFIDPKHRTPEAQAERQKIIQTCLDEKVFHKVQFVGCPWVWVTPRFMLLDADTKKNFCAVVYQFYALQEPGFGNQVDSVGLRSSLNDKQVGTFHPLHGLDLAD
ncbi:MAG: hypothetical protein AMXMBFR7_52950 [Planctomycetota bacterium]